MDIFVHEIHRSGQILRQTNRTIRLDDVREAFYALHNERMNLDHARYIAALPVDDSDDADRLKILIYALCDEIERLSASRPMGSNSAGR